MAAPRRVQLTPLSPISLGADLTAPPAPPAPCPQADRTLCTRFELLLIEPDDTRCAEFHYPELTAVTGKGGDEVMEGQGGDGDQLQILARKFEKKYGGRCKRRTDRVEDLVDLGYGYDDTDSFIDNSEPYDELVPASLTTKHGGFYINVGTLQFRQTADEHNETDDFEEIIKPKKRKLKEGIEVKMNKNKKKRKDGENLQKNHSVLSADKKKKASSKEKNLDGMLRKFHKEKLQELHLLDMKRKEPPPAAQQDSSDQVRSVSADLHRAEMEQGDFLTNDQNQKNRPSSPQNSVPEGLPPTLEQCLQELTEGIGDAEEGNKMEMFAPEINTILLKVSGLSDEVCSKIFSYLSSVLSCNKDTLLKRATKLRLLQLEDQLVVLIQRMEEAVLRIMPAEIHRFNDHCQAHCARLEAVKEKRAVEGSDDEEDESSGKRVFGPRKRFRWNEEIRELLCEVVKLKMSSYELEAPPDQSLEEYLKDFLETSVKTLWPRGWMQSRILLIQSRRVHAHVTGVVIRRKSRTVPKSEKCSADVQTVPVSLQQSVSQSQEIPSACGDVSLPQQRPAEEEEEKNLRDVPGVERDVYFPASLLCSGPISLAASAVMEGSCGDPALPTPSLSHQTSSPVIQLQASSSPSLPHHLKPEGHTEILKVSISTSVAPGVLQCGV